jgi:ribonucleoside-diphosphate reductase alpha chain
MYIIKRDGSKVDFDVQKIVDAIKSAMAATDVVEEEIAIEIAEEIKDECQHFLEFQGKVMTVEQVQDLVEDSLMRHGKFQVAKNYILYREEHKKQRQKQWEMTNLQRDILERKYIQDHESFDDFIKRVSNNDSKLAKAIRYKEFLFAGRILDGRGSEERKTYSNCFVLPTPKDNLESIFETGKLLARTFSVGGGAGIDLSQLRPNGAPVNNSAQKTTGSVSFGELYSFITGLISQKGRRGALMLTLDVDHPDIEEFITIKSNLDKITKANMSIKLNNEFMTAVKNDEEFTTKFEVVHNNGEKDIIEKTYEAKKLFRLIAKQNWDFAEPGALFWDRISSWYLLSEDEDYEYDSTNPCAEKPLPAYSNCLLGSINLSQFVNNEFTAQAEFDVKKFKEVVDLGVRGLNEALDEGLERLPFEENKKFGKNYRPIGLGIMGYADALIKLGKTYGSKEALKVTHKIGDAMIKQALKSSALLAKEHGPFPKFKQEAVLNSPFFKEHADEEIVALVKEHGLRNAELLSFAPTGSISTLLGVSGGIEPIYKISYTRKTETISDDGDKYYKVFTPIARKYMDQNKIKVEEKLPEYFITTHELDYKARIDTQAVWQHYVDASISSTVNLDEDTSISEVEDLYLYAWEKGLKGTTIFRDGCKRAGILGNHDTDERRLKEMSLEDLQVELSMRLDKKYKAEPQKCPKCGGELKRTNGCEVCVDCGWSPCSV